MTPFDAPGKQANLARILGFGVNPLPDMPILGSSNSTANKGMMSKIRTNGDSVL